MNPPLALPVSPSQSQAKIDEVLNRLHRLALESGAPQQGHAHSPQGHGQSQSQMGHMQQMQMHAQLQLQQFPHQHQHMHYPHRDTDSLSSDSSLSHSHSHTFSTTTTNTTTTSSASSSPPAAPAPSQAYTPSPPSAHQQHQPQPQLQQPQQQPQQGAYPLPPPFLPQQNPNPNLANVASLYRLGVPSRLQAAQGQFPTAYGMGALGPMSSAGEMGMGMSMQGLGGSGMGSAPGVSPTGKAYSYRPGDWICVSPACSYPNFGRNEYCNACRCPRPTSGTMPRATPAPPVSLAPSLAQGLGGNYYASPEMAPRFGQQRMGYAPAGQGVQGGGMGLQDGGMGMGLQGGGMGMPGLGGVAGACAGGVGGLGVQGVAGLGVGVGVPVVGGIGSPESARSPMLVTPSGRAFASAGSRKNVSGDDSNPVVIFWPDNEPIPERGQVRPCMLGLSQPPILNTGNKGPIEHQPGDWYCQKCEHLNWRRRKVCQNCYRFAEGNEDDTTPARQAECITVLIAQLVAAKKAQEAGVLLNLGNMMGVPGPGAYPGAGPGSDGQVTPGVKCPEGMMFAPAPQQQQFAPAPQQQQFDRQRVLHLQMPVPMRDSPSSLPSSASLYTHPVLAAAQAFEPAYSSPMLPSVLHTKALSALPSPPATGPISPLRINRPAAAFPLAPINTSPTALRAAAARRVSPPGTPLDPPKSARTNIWGPASGASSASPPSKRTNIWGPASGASSASPPSKWPDFAGGRRLTPPHGQGTPSPRGSFAESGSGSGGSARGSFSEGQSLPGLGGMAFTPCATSAGSVGPVGGPVAASSAAPASFKSTHPRLAGLHRA
ncbi:hypothetical protein CALVIDRAFT_526728 [Calocera viscosa TUFC12733]|uniref:RanBP2-type domain-containing protein n=1 Tax=Calocera viscosa (strain TUFC12733) TaxID=1330018 RepID=A0A167NDR5_CALVF|nr:hypothetical protein CALVIDRAFT_526728 [Calocera viscosa TUFC12733]